MGRRACSTNGEKRNASRILSRKPKGNRPLRRPRRRWVDNIKMDRKRDRMRWYGLNLAQYWAQWRARVNTVTKLRVP
jgi:hypothetical protein